MGVNVKQEMKTKHYGQAKKAWRGFTLLESMLVLAIAASLILVGLRQYRSFKQDSEVIALQSNIDALFNSAAQYYRAECNRGGQLDPAIATGSVRGINISTELINGGYLNSAAIKPNALVNSTGGYQGYVAQFNKYLVPRYQYTCSNPPTCSTTTQIQVGTYVIWRIQVSVLMMNTGAGQLAAMRSQLGGDCLTTASGSPATASLCASSPTGSYVAIDRLPSMAISDPDSRSPLWVSDPRYKQINQQYMVNPMTDLTSRSHSPEYQYFYCSG